MNYRVVIVNYAKTALTLDLLRQLESQTSPPESVWIIDNSPGPLAISPAIDFRFTSFPVHIRFHPENIGYTKACNLGGAEGHWDWLALVNSDIQIHDCDFFANLIPRCESMTELGCAGVAQCNPDGSYESVARKFPTFRSILGKRIPWTRRFFEQDVASYLGSYSTDFDGDSSPISVDWLQSSFLVVPQTVWKRLGGFDERFFVFMADTDFGLRCKRNGLRSWLFRDFKLHADGIRSSDGGWRDFFRKRVIRIHVRDAIRYFFL